MHTLPINAQALECMYRLSQTHMHILAQVSQNIFNDNFLRADLSASPATKAIQETVPLYFPKQSTVWENCSR